MDVEGAYEQAKTTGVVVARPERGLVRLTGPQRVWFLQNTITNDVEGVEAGRWIESCFLTAKGKVVAHFRVGVLEDEVLLDVDPPGTGPLIDWFERNRFRTKVEIEDVSRGCETVLGPRARDLAAPGDVVRADGVTFGDTLGEIATADVHGPAPDDLPRAPAALYDVFRLEAGIGRFGVDYGEGTLAQEAGLTRVLSVDKGCYVGQEVVARIHFRGHINKVLRRLDLEGVEPTEAVGADVLVDGQRVGTVTSAIHSPGAGPIGIGMIRVEPEDGTVAELSVGGKARIGPVPEGTKVAS